MKNMPPRENDSKRSRKARRKGRQFGRKAVKAASGAVFTLGAGLAMSGTAAAATFTVANLNDSGAGSLRQAILDANAAAGADVIDFQAGLTGTIILNSGQLNITDSVSIQGPGAATLTVSGNDSSRVFYLYNGSANIAVSISGLTIAHGNASIGGGLVNFDEDLTLDGVLFDSNHATSDGGALWADGFAMDLTVRNCTFSGNTAADDGGAIYVEDTGGPLLFQNDVITGNGAGGQGGGVYMYDPDQDITFEQCTISGNTSFGKGGGIYLYDTDGGNVVIRQTTISGNIATGGGGGVYLYGPDDPMVFENSTIHGNQSNSDGGGLFVQSLYSLALNHTTIAGNIASGAGGGIFVSSGALTIANSILADNTASLPKAPKALADIANGGDGAFNLSYSLVETPGSANVNDGGGNVLNQDPQLGALGNHGGPTAVCLPANTSPVVNAGDPAFAPPPTTDQRGTGFARVNGGRLDMGAVELAAGSLQFSLADYTVVENVATATIAVTRTGGSDGAVAVNYATSDGTAAQPGDYLPASGTLNWADTDVADKTFTVTIVDDNQVETDETVNLALSNPVGATLGTQSTAVLTIQDWEEGSLQFSLASYDVNESGGTATITVTRTNGSDGPVSVQYATSDGTAVQPGDYLPASGTLNWADGDTAAKTFAVTVIDDAAQEPVETVNLTLSAPQGGARLGAPNPAILNIYDNDTPIPALDTAGYSLLAGLLSTVALWFLRRRNGIALFCLALTLAFGHFGAVEAAAKTKTVKTGTVAAAKVEDGLLRLELTDGAVFTCPVEAVALKDRRGKHGQNVAAPTLSHLVAGQVVMVKAVDPATGGRRLRIQLYENEAKARQEADQKTAPTPKPKAVVPAKPQKSTSAKG